MKKKFFIFLSMIILLLTSFMMYKDYNKKLVSYNLFRKKIEHFKNTNFISMVLEEHWQKNLSYPSEFTPESVFNLEEDYPNLDTSQLSSLKNSLFIDGFNKKNDYYLYIPVKKNKKICGYVLLSSGFDGEFDNKFHEFNNFDDLFDKLSVDTTLDFSLKKYFFYNKDYLILSKNRCRNN